MMTENKKGWVVELIAIIVVGFVAVLFFAGWMYGMNLVNTELLNVEGIAGVNATNISDISGKTFGYMNYGLNFLTTIGFIIIFAFSLATLIMAYFAGRHPLLFIMYILIIVVVIVFSVYISNAYEELLNEKIFGGTLNRFSAANFVMLHLPTWMAVVGFIGLILMAAGIAQGRDKLM